MGARQLLGAEVARGQGALVVNDPREVRNAPEKVWVTEFPQLMPPTLIASIYGMNFKHMPELDTPYGYFVVLGVIAISCVFLFVRFKKAKWL